MPVLLINRATRKTAFFCLGIYAAVSLAFLLAPVLNPEKIGLGQTLKIALDPQFVKEQLNVYSNNFVLNPYMKDNSIHWLHMVAQADFYWNHVDVFSLAAFANTLAGRVLPAFIYKLPLFAALVLSVLLTLVGDRGKRLKLSLVMVMALTLTFFLSYNTVWEYQFALFQPAVAILFLLREQGGIFHKKWASIALAASVFLYLPTGYFLMRGRDLDTFMLNVIRADRVIPALIIFVALVCACAAELVREIRKK